MILDFFGFSFFVHDASAVKNENAKTKETALTILLFILFSPFIFFIEQQIKKFAIPVRNNPIGLYLFRA